MKLKQEQKLLDYIQSVRMNPSGFIGVHVYLSKIKPENKTIHKVKVVIGAFDKAVNKGSSGMFLLSNSDLVIICKGAVLKNIYKAIEDSKKLFSKDILIINDYEDSFAKIYSLDHSFSDFERGIQMLLDNIASLSGYMAAGEERVTPESLDGIMEKLETVNIRTTIKKQEVISISQGNVGQIFFEEYFIAIDDLKRILDTEINLLGDRWLFKHFTQGLDRKMLVSLCSLALKPHNKMSLNLNMDTLSSAEFKVFLSIYRPPVIVELQVSDIFEDIVKYKQAKEDLKKRGHKVLIDLVNDETLKLIDLSKLEADYIKVYWNSGFLGKDEDVSVLRDIIEVLGKEKIILCRCDSEMAVKWGLERGINLFQGYFIDNIISAMIKKECGRECTINDCIRRRHFVDPDAKKGCPNLDMLDRNPTVKFGVMK